MNPNGTISWASADFGGVTSTGYCLWLFQGAKNLALGASLIVMLVTFFSI